MLSNLITYKKTLNNIVHYIAVKDNYVVASIELESTSSGNLWVRHSVSDVSHSGYGLAMYKLAMSDNYPFGIMPSRECTSGFAVSLWDKILCDEEIRKTPITDQLTYVNEFDEWFDELLAVNPLLSEHDILGLELDFSFLDAVKNNKLVPHPYNHSYTMPNKGGSANIITAKPEHNALFEDAVSLFYSRYEKLDF